MTGGAATHGWRVPLSDVRLPAAAIEAAREALASGWLSSGPRVREFEEDLAAYVGTAHAVACSSGTAALELAYEVLDLGPGDEIAMPSLSFVAGANAARLRGAEPVFCDVVGQDDLTIDPGSLANAITPRTRAVVLMHYGGRPCLPETIEVAREHGLLVIEDAAHALGAAGREGRCGTWGDVACFSFFANKNLPLGEGGMVTTDDPELAERALRLRSHGMTTATWERHTGAAASYDVRVAGHNFRFDEARAAMGRVLCASSTQATSVAARSWAATGSGSAASTRSPCPSGTDPRASGPPTTWRSPSYRRGRTATRSRCACARPASRPASTIRPPTRSPRTRVPAPTSPRPTRWPVAC